MKKNMFALAALLIASATFVACSSDDNIANENQQPANGKYTMTVQASKGMDTRALTLDGTTLNATWTNGEVVLVYQNGSPIGTLNAAASTNAETTLTGTLDDAPSTSADLTFYFHTAATPSYSGQDGTLATIALTYDFCDLATVTAGNFTVNTSDKTVTSADINFGDNQQAIVKFTLKDKANNAISATQLVVNNGTNDYTITPASGTSELYVAIPGISGKTVTLTATVGDDTYTYKKSGVTFTNGEYYDITVKMTQAPALNLTSLAVGQVIGSDGKNYAAGSVPTGVTAVAKICYVSGSNGLALALTDEGQMIWSTAISTCAAHTPAFTGGTWKLATQEEWNNMITAAGSYTALRTGFDLQSGSYWSSTEDTEKENDSWHAWSYNFGSGMWWSDHKSYYDGMWVRACLAWTQAAAAPAAKAAAEATAEDKGKLIGTDGNIYADVAAATAAGTTAVAKIVYVGSDNGESAPYNHGLALALSDANGGGACMWKTSNTDAGHTYKPTSSSFSSESGLQYNATHNSDTYPAFKAAIANNGTAAPTGCSSWFLASGYQWTSMINAAGGYVALRDGFSSVGGSNLQSGYYWSSTENGSDRAWIYGFYYHDWGHDLKVKDNYIRVRACLAF